MKTFVCSDGKLVKLGSHSKRLRTGAVAEALNNVGAHGAPQPVAVPFTEKEIRIYFGAGNLNVTSLHAFRNACRALQVAFFLDDTSAGINKLQRGVLHWSLTHAAGFAIVCELDDIFEGVFSATRMHNAEADRILRELSSYLRYPGWKNPANVKNMEAGKFDASSPLGKPDAQGLVARTDVKQAWDTFCLDDDPSDETRIDRAYALNAAILAPFLRAQLACAGGFQARGLVRIKPDNWFYKVMRLVGGDFRLATNMTSLEINGNDADVYFPYETEDGFGFRLPDSAIDVRVLSHYHNGDYGAVFADLCDNTHIRRFSWSAMHRALDGNGVSFYQIHIPPTADTVDLMNQLGNVEQLEIPDSSWSPDLFLRILSTMPSLKKLLRARIDVQGIDQAVDVLRRIQQSCPALSQVIIVLQLESAMLDGVNLAGGGGGDRHAEVMLAMKTRVREALSGIALTDDCINIHVVLLQASHLRIVSPGA